MMRLARTIGSAALCALALSTLPGTAGAEDVAPQPLSQPQPQPQPLPTYIPQGARVFSDGKTMLYDQSGNRGNVTPDRPPTADAPADKSTKLDASSKDSSNADAAANNSTVGSSTVKHWQRPAAPPEVIAAWLDKCNPVSYEDSEHVKRIRFAAKDCDLTDPRQ
jgi:hypothetical protein